MLGASAAGPEELQNRVGGKAGRWVGLQAGGREVGGAGWAGALGRSSDLVAAGRLSFGPRSASCSCAKQIHALKPVSMLITLPMVAPHTPDAALRSQHLSHPCCPLHAALSQHLGHLPRPLPPACCPTSAHHLMQVAEYVLAPVRVAWSDPAFQATLSSPEAFILSYMPPESDGAGAPAWPPSSPAWAATAVLCSHRWAATHCCVRPVWASWVCGHGGHWLGWRAVPNSPLVSWLPGTAHTMPCHLLLTVLLLLPPPLPLCALPPCRRRAGRRPAAPLGAVPQHPPAGAGHTPLAARRLADLPPPCAPHGLGSALHDAGAWAVGCVRA